MSSQAQIDANRENARLSTGATSPDGKAASAQNARTHGFSSQTALQTSNVIPPDQLDTFNTFQQDWHDRLQPQGPIEDFLFRRILHAAWTVEMIDQTQASLFPSPADMYLDETNEKRAARFDRYRTMHMRLYHQAMRSFQYEQTQRGLRAAAPPQVAELAAQAPPQANLPKITEFAKRSQIHDPFSTYPPEFQDQIFHMEAETRHLLASIKQRQQERRDHAAA